MRAVILAAGMGSRLGASMPKPLVDIGPGVTLLSNQIDVLSGLLGRERIVLAIGHRADEIRAAHPDIRSVYNARHRETNTAVSLLCALRTIQGEVLWVNGDLYFEAPTALRLIQSSPGFTRCLVNRNATGAEEIKYRLGHDGAIVAISKNTADSAGEALGMNIVSAGDLSMLRDELEAAADTEYFEEALERCARAGIRLAPVYAGDDFCREVDFPEDLAAVRRHVAERVGM